MGKAHSNIDPLSRLPRVLPHQSPAVDGTWPIKDVIPEQPLKAWEARTKEPAARVTFPVLTWEDVMEASPEDPSAWMVTRGRVKKQREKSRKEEEPAEEEEKQEEDEDMDGELEEVQKKRGTWS